MEAKTVGGLALLDREDRKRLDSERDEPDNSRPVDALGELITSVINRSPGGYEIDRDWEVPIPGSRLPDYFTFDRWYPSCKLLVMFVDSNAPNAVTKDEVNGEIKRLGDFARTQGLHFLPVIDGRVYVTDVRRALGV